MWPRLSSLLIAVAVYAIGMAAGFTAPSVLAETYTRELRRIALQAYMLPPYALYLLILSNNMGVALLAFLSGVALVPPLLILFVNGVIVGSIAGFFAKWYSLLEFIHLILPHGVFEIPAFLLASALGIDVALDVLEAGPRAALRGMGERARGLLVVFALLAVAAAIETLGIYTLR